MKRCSRCREVKPKSEFYRSKKSKSGLSSCCKDCDRKRKEVLNYEPQTGGYKTCSRCGRTLHVSQFHKRKLCKDGLYSWCKSCCSEVGRKYYQENKERITKRNAQYVQEHYDKTQEDGRLWWGSLKREAFEAYGGAFCSWPGCTEARFECLSLDHIGQDAADRRRAGEPTGRQLYTWLRDQGWPDGFRVLCRNHNWKAFREHLRQQWKSTPQARYSRQRNLSLTQSVLRAYSDGMFVRCTLCGESDIEVLSLDHVNGGGCKHHREIRKTNLNLYEFLRREGYPNKDSYRVLCRNCNWYEGRKRGNSSQ